MQREGAGVRVPGVFLATVVMAVVGAAVTTVNADVYYYKDANGVFHFTNEKRDGSVLFKMDKSIDRLASRRPEQPDLPKYTARGGDYESYIQRWAAHYDVDPALVRAVIRAESGFNTRAVSRAGARGLMQLMPTTAKLHGVRNVYSPEDNIRGGVKHLRKLLDRYGDNVTMALAAYNAGEAHVDRHRGIPPITETRIYVARVLKYRREYHRVERLQQAKAN